MNQSGNGRPVVRKPPQGISETPRPDDPRVIAALEEYASALQAGQAPDRDAFLARHPEIAAVLAECLEGLEWMRGAAPGKSVTEFARVPAVAGVAPGTSLGDFLVLREVGRGGMGVVYEAEQLSLGRRVALKVLPLAAALDAKQLQRFKNEAHAAAQLHHTNIVPVYGVGCECGVHFYAMQLIDGQTLAALITELRQQAGLEVVLVGGTPAPQGGPVGQLLAGKGAAPAGSADPQLTGPHRSEVPRTSAGATTCAPVKGSAGSAERSLSSPAFFRTVAQLGIQAAQALEHAHQLGVIHRDIKPGNLLVETPSPLAPVGRGVGAEGLRLWITDFGLCQTLKQAALTQTGDLLGTLRYMSPEQALARRGGVDHRTDVYSLGLTLYELLTLEPAFTGSNCAELLRQIAREEPVPPRRLNKAIPRELDSIVLKAMEKNPKERYASARELADDLERFLNDEPIRARQPTWVQRARKWARRHRGVAAELAGVALLLVLIVAGSLVAAVHFKHQEQEQHALADTNKKLAADAETGQKREAGLRAEESGLRKQADAARQLAENRREELGQNLYTAEMNLAGQAAALPGGIARVNGLLLPWRPKGTEPDRRGWEWYYLYGLGHRSLVTLREHGMMKLGQGPAWGLEGLLACPRGDGTIKIWDSTTGRDRLTLRGHTDVVWMAEWDRDGKRLASASHDGTVKLWDAGTGKEVHTLRGHSAAVRWVSWGPDGTQLASTSDDRTVKVWDAASGKATRTLRGHATSGASVAWSPDGKRLASTDVSQIKVWEPATGKEICSRGIGALSVAWSPDGARLAGGGTGGIIWVWDVAGGQEPVPLRASTDWVRSVAWGPDGTRLASASDDRTIKVWDVKTGEERLRLREHSGPVNGVAWSRDGRRLASASWDGTIKVWDATTPPEMVTHRIHSPSQWVWAWSRDGKRLASGSPDGTIKLWDVASGKEQLTLRGHSPGGQALAWGPDGTSLASASVDKTVKVWDTVSGKETITWRGHTDGVYSVIWGPGGKRLASADVSQIKVWDPATGKVLLTIRHHTRWAVSVAWDPDGKRLASINGEGETVTVWDAATGKERLTLRGHTSLVAAVAWGPDGTRLATSSYDGVIKLWDPATGKVVLTLQGHTSRVDSLAWSPDGTRLVSGGADHTVKIWDAATGKEVLSLPGHSLTVSSVAWSRDGLRVASASNDGTIHIHDASIGHAAERSVAAAAARGKRALAGGKLDEAITAYREVIGAEPDDALAHSNVGVALVRKGLLDEAIAECREAIRLEPDDAQAHNALGVALCRQRKYAEAEAEFREALRCRPDYDKARTNLRHARAMQKKLADAAVQYQEAIRRLRHFEQAKGAAGCRAAAELLEQLERTDAGSLYDAACFRAVTAAVLRASDKSARAAAQAGAEADRAMAHLRQAVTAGYTDVRHMRWDKDLDALRDRADFGDLMAELLGSPGLGPGMVHAERGEWDRAVAVYARAFENKAPDDPYAWFEHACLYAQVGDSAGYRKLCRRMRERFGTSLDVEDVALLAQACLLAPGGAGDAAAAIRLAERRLALTRSPSHDDAWSAHLVGLAYYRAGQDQKAIEWLSKGLKVHPDWRLHGWLVLAMAHDRLGQADEARKCCDKAEQWLKEKTRNQLNQGARVAPPGWPWRDWLLVQLSRREAEDMLKKHPGARGPEPRDRASAQPR
jgi:WD40 repeat protein/serine/threonine protein kinase/tetratricopeptide (TPR) repeat protein